MLRPLLLSTLALLAAIVAVAFENGSSARQVQPAPLATEQTAHAFTFEGLLGGEIRMADHRNKAVLVVNTATECGLTPQLEGLQKLYQGRAGDGLVVIGVPSNDFGGQEPRQGKAIAEFCELNYGVNFPMAARTRVTGRSAHPFYRWAAVAFGQAGVPRWNFHKLLIGPDGRPVAAFDSRVPPNDPRLLAAIDKALAARS